MPEADWAIRRRAAEATAAAGAASYMHTVYPVKNNDTTLAAATDSDANDLNVKNAQRAAYQKKYYTDTQSTYQSSKTSLSTNFLQKATFHQPILERPKNPTVLNPKQVVEELKGVYDKIKDINSDQHILRLIFEGLETQRTHRGMSIHNSHHKISLEQTFQKNKQKQEIDLHKQLDEALKGSSTTSWIGAILTIANMGLLVTSIIASIVTFGATISLALTCANALVAIGSGVNSIFQADYKNKGNKNSSEIELVKHERDTSHGHVKTRLENSKTENEQISELASIQRQMQENAYQASRYEPQEA